MKTLINLLIFSFLGIFSINAQNTFKTNKVYTFCYDADCKLLFCSFTIEEGLMDKNAPIEFIDELGNKYKVAILKMQEEYLNEWHDKQFREVTTAKKGATIQLDFALDRPQKASQGVFASVGTVIAENVKTVVKANVFGKVNSLELVDGHDSKQNIVVPPNTSMFNNKNRAFQINFLFKLNSSDDLGGQILIRGDFDEKIGKVNGLEVCFTGKTVVGKQTNNFFNGTIPNPSNFAVSFTKIEKKAQSYVVSGSFSGTLKPLAITKLLKEYDNSKLDFIDGRFENISIAIPTKEEMAKYETTVNSFKRGF